MEKLELGCVAKDRFTDFQGIVMAHTNYLYGCARYGILPEGLKDGKPQDWVWFDEPQLIFLAKNLDEYLNHRGHKKSGGPRPDAPGR